MVLHDIWPAAKPCSLLGEVTPVTHWKIFAFRSKADRGWSPWVTIPAGGISKKSQVIHPCARLLYPQWPISYLTDDIRGRQHIWKSKYKVLQVHYANPKHKYRLGIECTENNLKDKTLGYWLTRSST